MLFLQYYFKVPLPRMRYLFCALVFGALALSSDVSEAAKILAIAPLGGRSHFILQYPLYKALAAAGHEITVMSPFPNKTPIPNYSDIYLKEVEVLFKTKTDELKKYASENKFQIVNRFFSMGIEMSELILTGSTFQGLLKSNATFDLIILELFLSDSMIGLGHYYNAPIIGISTVGATKFINDYLGNPNTVSYIPHPLLPLTSRMTFFERLNNFVSTYFAELYTEFVYHPKQELIYNKAFSDPKPSYSEARKTAIELGLVNMHFSLGFGRPYVSNLIEVGGMHVNRKENPLPKDILEFIESAKNGVIYFSLGSNLKPTTLDLDKRQAIIKTLLKRKEHVIWKWDGELQEIADKKNILVSKWLPQDDILRHPNIRVFITHGGLLSITETIYHGVPVVGIPFFGDQSLNMAKAEQAGYGKMCKFDTLTEESLTKSIDEVINNKSYKEKIIGISKRFRDQPMHPLDLAVYWVEYVLRHKGAKHMRSAALDLNFFQLHSFDTIGFIVGVLCLLMYVIYFVLKKLFRMIFGNSTKKSKKMKET